MFTRKDRKGWWYKFRDPITGTQHLKYGGPNRTACKDRVVEVKAKILKKEPIIIKSQGFSEFALDFLENRKDLIQPESYEREKSIIGKHLIPFFKMKLDKISPEKITKKESTVND